MADDTQPAITATDPRVAQILAMIQAKAAAPPVSTDPGPQLTQQIAPQAPVAPPQVPGVAQPPQMGPPVPTDPSQMAATLPQQAMPQDQPGISPQPKPGPIKSFLQGLVSNLGTAAYAGTQGALQRLGIPTDYEKQQNAAHLAIAQQAANDTSAYRQAQIGGLQAKSDQLDAQNKPYTFGTDDSVPAQLRGQTFPTVVAQGLLSKLGVQQMKGDTASSIAAGNNLTSLTGKQIQYGPDSYLRRSVKSIGGRIISFDKGDPGNQDKQVDMGPDTALITGPANANARAYDQAKYGIVPTVDASGAPTVISRLAALQNGAPQVNFNNAKGIVSDMVGVKQYQDILDNKITPNLSALNDPSQRIAIAHTLSEADKNPSMIQALITSGLQAGALSPQGAQLAAGIMQGREFGGVARKYGGNMNGTEGLMNRIMANQASPLNSQELNQDLIQNDRSFTDKALGSITNLMSNSKRTGVQSNPTPQVPSAPVGGITVTAPDGSVHPFATQAQADKFKQLAGIK